jgi:hypothetical protein
MILIAVAQRDGEPVACAYGCARNGQTVSAGLLFVLEALPDRRLDFTVIDADETLTLQLPEAVATLERQAFFIGAELEVVNVPES